jgi:hypothetical protein
MHVYYQGIRVELEVTGTSQGVAEDGSPVIFVHIEPIIPSGPRGPGEPVELPRAA